MFSKNIHSKDNLDWRGKKEKGTMNRGEMIEENGRKMLEIK